MNEEERFEFWQTVAEAISLCWTAPVLVFSALVVLVFLREGVKTVWNIRQATREQLLVLGVMIGFASKFLDNLYWAVPWSLDFVGDPRQDIWHMSGVFSNIFTRQVLGHIAAMCHLVAAWLPPRGQPLAKKHRGQAALQLFSFNILSFTLGAFFVWILWLERQG